MSFFGYLLSDDRSVDVFRNKLESATQMKAVMGADPRPNCLVIDEIDGAPTVCSLICTFVEISVFKCEFVVCNKRFFSSM